MIRIAQISDCHVSADPRALYRNRNPRQSLEGVIEAVSRWQPDLLLVTGDLAEDGSRNAYQYLYELTHTLGVPVLTIPGNHDNAELQREVFSNTPVDEPLGFDFQGWEILLLNSSMPGEIPGSFSQAECLSLASKCSQSDHPKLVVLHHQPVQTGSLWIDKYALNDPEKFWKSISSSKSIKAVVWGHIHHAFEARKNGVELLGTPATSVNSLPKKERFTFDPEGPGFRWFLLGETGEIESGVTRVPV
jgi:Icc protein